VAHPDRAVARHISRDATRCPFVGTAISSSTPPGQHLLLSHLSLGERSASPTLELRHHRSGGGSLSCASRGCARGDMCPFALGSPAPGVAARSASAFVLTSISSSTRALLAGRRLLLNPPSRSMERWSFPHAVRSARPPRTATQCVPLFSPKSWRRRSSTDVQHTQESFPDQLFGSRGGAGLRAGPA